MFGSQRLLSQIFVHGLFVLAASALTFGMLTALLVRPGFDRDSKLFGEWAAPALCVRLGDIPLAQAEAPGFAATVFTAEGNLRGTLTRPALPRPSPAELARLRTNGWVELDGSPLKAFACPRSVGGYVVIAPPAFGLSARLIAPFLLVILLVALASLRLARSIAAPLGRVVEVTRAFGRGDFAARADATRRDEVGDLAHAFNDMAQRIERLVRAEKELLANVSHELRTPLARIRVVLETAQEDPRRAQSLLDEIDTDLAELEGLVGNIMDSMRLDIAAGGLPGGQLPAVLARTDLRDVAREVLERFRSLHPERDVALVSQPEPHQIAADARLLRRLFDNLLQNASKYSSPGTPIMIRLSCLDGGVRVDVEDHGIGIEPADLEHVLEPFFRGDRSRSRSTGGAGLGLALVKRIVDVHGGTISIASQVGRGTTVSIHFQRATPLAARTCRPSSSAGA